MRLTKILLSVILAMLAAVAQPAVGAWRSFGEERFDLQAQDQRSGGKRRQPQGDIRPPEPPPQRGQRPDRRLTEEERRELRRDIERANREIYKGQQR